MSNINVLVPMAGEGSRFVKAGYTTPKPFIKIFDKELVRYAMDNVQSAEHNLHFILVAREEHVKSSKEQIEELKKDYDCSVLTVPSLTEGAACTTLVASLLIDNDNPLFIINCDQFLNHWNPTEFYRNALLYDGSIVTIETNRTDFSYARLYFNSNFVSQTAEKKVISTHGTVGYYFWTRGHQYVSCAKEMIAARRKHNNEYYVCPVYNEGIGRAMNFTIYPVESMTCLGTPEDVSKFIGATK